MISPSQFYWSGETSQSLITVEAENMKQRRGRCHTWWRDAVEHDAKLARIDQDLESMAADKVQWQDMLALLVS